MHQVINVHSFLEKNHNTTITQYLKHAWICNPWHWNFFGGIYWKHYRNICPHRTTLQCI